MSRKIISLVLSFGLLFQQVSFAQVAAELNLGNYLSRIGSNIIQDKFRPLHLRYFSYDTLNDNFKVLLDKGDLKNLKAPELENSTKTLLGYFLVGVTLPDEVFWVNLRPDSENQIIDPWLEKTDVGRIMLEADLQLKKDTAQMTSPATPEGKEYWDRLYKKAAELYGYDNVTIPTLTRPWIVPGEIIVRESKDSAYIYKATLKVMLEQDYLKESATYNFKDERSKALNEYSSQLIRELIIPKLTKEVNSSKRYAALRQVYYSLILSRWFKLRFTGKTGTYASLINTRNLTNLTSQEPWSKTTYFKQYQKSFQDGEYNIKEPVYTPTGQVIRSYFSGGINVANGAINTQNGILLSNDHAAKLGDVVGDRAVVDPRNINLKPATAASAVEGSLIAVPAFVKRLQGWSEINCINYKLTVEYKPTLTQGSGFQLIWDSSWISEVIRTGGAAKPAQLYVGPTPDIPRLITALYNAFGGEESRFISLRSGLEDDLKNAEVFKESASSAVNVNNINVEMYKEQLRPILQDVNENKNVLDEIKRLDKEGKLLQMFPVMEVLKGKPKYVTKVFEHTLRVIEELELIKKGDMNSFNSRIEEWRKDWPKNWTFTWKFTGKEGEDLFNKYRQIFQDVTRTPEDRELLYLIALLHDVGEYVKTQGHPNESARMIEPWLKQIGFSQEKINEVKSVLRSHVDLGTLYFAERTPDYLSSNPESLNIDLKTQKGQEYIKILSLLTFVDTGEAIVGEKAEFYAEVGNNPKYLDELRSNFYQRRKELFSSRADEKIDGKKYIKVNEELKKLERFLTKDEMDKFVKAINSGIEVIDYCIFFCRGLKGDSLIKMLFIMHKLIEGKDIKRANLTAPSGMAPTVAAFIDIRMLEDWDLGDIVRISSDADALKIRLKQVGLDIREREVEKADGSKENQLFIDNWQYYRTKLISQAKWLAQNISIAKPEELEKALRLFEVHLQALKVSLQNKSIDLEKYISIDSVIDGIRQDLGKSSKDTKFVKKLKGELADIVDEKDVPVEVTEAGFTHIFGLRHRTSNAFVFTPDGKLFLQRRVHNKAEAKTFSIAGGHVVHGTTYAEAASEELLQELKLYQIEEKLEGNLILIGQEGQFQNDDAKGPNNEFRSLYAYVLTEKEWAHVKKIKDEIDTERAKLTETEFEKWIEEEQKKPEGGLGEVWGYHVVDLSSIKNVESVHVVEVYKDGPKTQDVGFSSDLLLPLIKGTAPIKLGTPGINPIEEIENKLNSEKPTNGSSPVKTGGIDFRALPMTIQPMGSFNGLNFRLPQLSQAELEKINVAIEIQQIKGMVQAGITPSGERIKELVAACIQKKEIGLQNDSLLLCIADIFKLQEGDASETSPELKEALVIVDSQI